jgi:hypothetical protein
MLTLKTRAAGDYGEGWKQREIIFVGKCGHLQKGNYVPFTCPKPDCKERLPQADKLIGEFNQDNRVKYFAEGKI